MALAFLPGQTNGSRCELELDAWLVVVAEEVEISLEYRQTMVVQGIPFSDNLI